jgi:RNA-directed DNA polymerase
LIIHALCNKENGNAGVFFLMAQSEQRKEIQNRFSAAKEPEDVASLLGVSWEKLRYWLYRRKESQRYRQFEIPKKAGGKRLINAPGDELKELQRELNQLLEVIYEPRLSTHGFALNRSIVTNAESHVGARFVFNLDLSDFFSSIHLGRVRGLFMKRPFLCKPSVATVLAQLCCYEGKLPQGAPTSPIITNLICGKMDVDLQRFARSHACTYTRYADDITFSTERRVFPPAIAFYDKITGKLQVGEGLLSIIQKNTFVVNEAKLRLQNSNRRQIVTGLKVNRFPNVPRKFLSQVRAMLHAWDKFSLDCAEKEYDAKYNKKRRAGTVPSFKNVLKGKIEFVGMVRGKNSPAFLKLARQLKKLDEHLVKDWDLDSAEDKIRAAICVLEALKGDSIYQGTGFFLKDYGLVTCRHVLHEGLEAFRGLSPETKHGVEVVLEDKELDLAILKTSLPTKHFLEGSFREPKRREQVVLCGFPQYAKGASEVIVSVQIVGTRKYFGSIIYLIDKPIIEGNSGGPILDMGGKVIGVAARGIDTMGEANVDKPIGFIPILNLLGLTGKA